MSASYQDLRDAQQILRQRAEALARVLERGGGDDGIDVLVCHAAGELYAVELRQLGAVQAGREIAPVPDTPAYVVGVMNVRGELVTVLDLAAALGLTRTGETEGEVLLVEVEGKRFGLLVDDVVDVERVHEGALHASLSQHELARGIARAEVVLLDCSRLVTSGKFDVSSDVS